MNKYTPEVINKNLTQLTSWQYQNDKLNKRFIFTDFIMAFDFMREIAVYAEEINHHPEWCNVYKTVEVNLITHDAQGITSLDFDLAKKMDSVERKLMRSTA